MAHTVLDDWLTAVDASMRTVFSKPRATRRNPGLDQPGGALTAAERRESAALMRVNHVGEVCAQALYTAQSLATSTPHLRAHFAAASDEETDHLAWTRERLEALDGRVSLLTPLWYAGAFGIGYLAGKLGGDALNLGFVMETERQVEAHLQGHLNRLSPKDEASRAVILQMQRDEVRHAQEAKRAGAAELPDAARQMMRAASKLMTTVAHHI